MLENIRANQQFQDARAVRLGSFRFHAFLHPLPPLGIGNVHELRTNRAAINAARRFGVRARNVEFGHSDRFEIAQRIEVRLQVSPAPKRLPSLALCLFGGR
jgi:hypothetical protein